MAKATRLIFKHLLLRQVSKLPSNKLPLTLYEALQQPIAHPNPRTPLPPQHQELTLQAHNQYPQPVQSPAHNVFNSPSGPPIHFGPPPSSSANHVVMPTSMPSGAPQMSVSSSAIHTYHPPQSSFVSQPIHDTPAAGTYHSSYQAVHSLINDCL